MGAPAEDAGRLHDWSMWIQRQFDPIRSPTPSSSRPSAKVAEFYAWVRPLIARRRASPADDLISVLIAAEEEGDRLDDAELENLVLTSSSAASTRRRASSRTRSGCSPRAPSSGRRPRRSGGLAPRAVEEALRFEPITPLTARLRGRGRRHRGVDVPGRHGR